MNVEVSVEVLAIGILWAPHLAQYLLNVLAHFQNLLVLARSQTTPVKVLSISPPLWTVFKSSPHTNQSF